MAGRTTPEERMAKWRAQGTKKKKKGEYEKRRMTVEYSRLNSMKIPEIKDFFNLHRNAGKLSVCKNCHEDQKDDCEAKMRCFILDRTMMAYLRAHKNKDPMEIEAVAIPQLAIMDLIFTQKLQYAINNLNEKKEFTDENGVKHEKDVIGIEYLYALINMAKSLSKSLDDMQLTSKTQDASEQGWMELLKVETDPVKSEQMRRKIMASYKSFEKKKEEVKKLEDADDALRQYEKDKEQFDNEESVVVEDIPKSPFAIVKEGQNK